MDGGGQARRGRHETRRLGDISARPKKKNEGQQFAMAEGTDTRTQPWNRLTNLLPLNQWQGKVLEELCCTVITGEHVYLPVHRPTRLL